MKARDITLIRWVIVVFYVFLGMGVAMGGVSTGELTLMVVGQGVSALVAVISADWINEAALAWADEQ